MDAPTFTPCLTFASTATGLKHVDPGGAFNKRMSLDEANTYLKDQSPYDILEVASNSNWEMVKKAFRKMAMKWHPDKNPDNITEAEEKMKKILAAYTIIKNIVGK